MKKSTMIAAIFAASAFAACAADVYSSNIVGYNKITLNPGYNLVSAQFVPVGGDLIGDVEEVLNSLTLPGVDPDGDGRGYARLMTWNVNKYDIYEWAGTTLVDAWEWPETENKWMTALSQDIAEIPLAKDQGFWLWLDPSVVQGSKTVVFSGEVPESGTAVTNNLVAGFNLVANPWPVAVDIQDFVVENLPGVNSDGDGTGYARLQTWNVNKYDIYEWAGDTLVEAWEWPETENKWMTALSQDIATDVTIGVGEGFWVWLDPTQTYTDPKIIFTAP